jgi:hypothetical protein
MVMTDVTVELRPDRLGLIELSGLDKLTKHMNQKKVTHNERSCEKRVSFLATRAQNI